MTGRLLFFLDWSLAKCGDLLRWIEGKEVRRG